VRERERESMREYERKRERTAVKEWLNERYRRKGGFHMEDSPGQ